LRPEAAGFEPSNQGTLTERERRLSSTFGLLIEVSWFVAHVNHIFNSKSYYSTRNCTMASKHESMGMFHQYIAKWSIEISGLFY
jgi:hypothetical protein